MKVLTVSGMVLLGLSLVACRSKQQQAQQELSKQQTPLTADAFVQAARAGEVEKLPLFLQAGMDVNAATADGQTAFNAAVAERQRQAADFLLQHGVDVNANTPLIKVAADGDAEWLNYLLENGANPNLTDADNRAPLTVTNNPAILSVLLQAGAQPDEHGVQGQPPVVWAAAAGDLALVEKLLDAGADVDTIARPPAEKKFLATVGDELLVYYLRKDSGVTPLMLAAGRGDLEMVKLLLARGAKKFRETKHNGSPAVYIACENQRTAVIRLLLGKSVDPASYPCEIKISLAKQRLTVTRGGELWYRAAISSGAKDFETPRGEFVVTNKYEEWNSTIYDNAPMPFFLRLNCGPVGLHAGALPGYPASHGCIRLSPSAAEKLFKHIDIGTVVNISD